MEASVSHEVLEVLAARFGSIEPAGAGAWSAAFKFERGGRDLIVRVGPHVSDFRVDAEMSAYASPTLPIPEVLELDRLDPPHDDLHICVSTYAPGVPLELVTPAEWVDLVPIVADLLDALRAVPAPDDPAVLAWSEILTASPDRAAGGRLGGWSERLAAHPAQLAGYEAAMSRLTELSVLPPVANVPRTLLHCDLINRNVHVADGSISGIFDWGCRRWGDHLYDIAWFEFWDPWMTNLDIKLLRSEMISRWGDPPDPDRLTACLLHIGADHLVYSAAIDDPEGGREILGRLVALGLI